MTWHERVTVLIIAGVFAAGYLLGEYGHWQDRLRRRRRERLIERMKDERQPTLRSPW